MRKIYMIALCAVMGLSWLGCSRGVDVVPEIIPPDEDLIPYEPEQGKADGFGFDPHFLMEDEVFEDHEFLTQPQIQAFLESTPYGRRSFLADFVDDGLSVSAQITESARRWQINPLVLLTKLQVESSVVFRQTAPGTFQLDRAMGCGCPDNDPSCSVAPKGLAKQIDCAARLFRSYLNELSNNGETRSGWRIGRARDTLDPEAITPRNAATAALYTYTPWVLRRQGGNWLFWNVYHRFARVLLAEVPNHRFIGGPCSADSDCRFEDGFCYFPEAEMHELTPSDFAANQHRGVCTKTCERTCPDRSQPNTSITFCADTGDSGLCLPRCNGDMFDDNMGCDNRLVCVNASRRNESNRFQDVCMPQGAMSTP